MNDENRSGRLSARSAAAGLAPQATRLLERVAQAARPPLHTLAPVDARREFARMEVLDIAPRPVAGVADLKVPGAAGEIAARLYRGAPSAPAANGRRGHPLLVFSHGGGFIVGSLDSCDAVCRMLAVDARCAVLSLDYRLAPEHRFPAAADDVFAACCWTMHNAERLGCDPRRIAIGGDSAGGTLSAQACVRLRDAGLSACAQVLIYPGTDSHRRSRSHRRYAEGMLLDARTIDWFCSQYLTRPGDALDPRFAPMRTSDLSRLPPTLMVLAGCDPLHDEGAAYAGRLRAAGVEAEVMTFAGMLHGFFNMGLVLDAALDAHSRVTQWLRRRFDPVADRP